MSGEPATGGNHPGDGDLVRLLDGETGDGDLWGHVESCRACRRRLREIEEWSRGVTRALRDADPLVRREDGPTEVVRSAGRDGGEGPLEGGEAGGAGSPSGGSSGGIVAGIPTGLRVAAGVVLLASAGLAVDPVRGWVVEQVERIGRRLAPGGTSTPGGGTGASGASVSFVPQDTEITIRLAAPQRRGRLVVVVSESGTEVSASVTGDARGALRPALSVFPTELRIRNDPQSGASYRVSVPPATDHLDVRVGERRLARLRGGEIRPGRTWSWALAPADAPGPAPD